MKKRKVVIVGCGAVAYRWYFDGLKKSDLCDIVALIDINEQALSKAAEYCKVDKTFNNLDDFCRKKIECDIIVVLTSHKSHYQIIKKCLSLGYNVYSEKPFAESYKQAKELITLAENNNLLLCSAPQVMLSSRNKKTKELVSNGFIGDVVMVRASGSNMGPAARPDTNYDPVWFYNDGGSIASLGIYTLALVLFIFGVPKKVVGFSGIAIPERTVIFGPCAGKKFNVTAPDNEVALLKYNNSMYVLFDGSYSVKNQIKYELIIHGTLGTLYVGGFGGKGSILYDKGDGIKEIGPDDDCHLRWNLSWGVDEMARAMNENREPCTNARFAAETINVIESIRKSEKTDMVIHLMEEE